VRFGEILVNFVLNPCTPATRVITTEQIHDANSYHQLFSVGWLRILCGLA
jgi:hypothetical protein